MNLWRRAVKQILMLTNVERTRPKIPRINVKSEYKSDSSHDTTTGKTTLSSHIYLFIYLFTYLFNFIYTQVKHQDLK